MLTIDWVMHSQGYQNNLSGFTISFAVVSFPIFILAWYLGKTVSDVSFNIRRREIGLLSTKGLSSGQIQRMFLSEAIIIGLMGGFLGVIGGLLLNQYYSGSVNLNSLFTSKLFSPEIALFTVIFGVILALMSVFLSSRRASRIPAVEALRNDMSAGDKPNRKIFPLIALILGSLHYHNISFRIKRSHSLQQLVILWRKHVPHGINFTNRLD